MLFNDIIQKLKDLLSADHFILPYMHEILFQLSYSFILLKKNVSNTEVAYQVRT